MSGDQNMPMGEGLLLEGELCPENSVLLDHEYWHDIFERQNHHENSRILSQFNPPEDILTDSVQVSIPFPSYTYAIPVHPLAPGLILKQRGEHATHKRTFAEKSQAEFVEGSNNDGSIADSTRSVSIIEHERVKLQRAQMADVPATQRNCANKREQKKERKDQKQVAEVETRGRPRNSLLKNYRKYKAKEEEKQMYKNKDKAARTKHSSHVSALKCRIVESAEKDYGFKLDEDQRA